jgi:aminoglycoside phosphotransferase (APT) family kinase protein
VDSDRGLMLVDLMPGVAWFHPPADPAEQDSVAKDFITHIATWHKATARALDLPTFQPVRSVREHQLDQLAGIKRAFEDADARQPIDALARLELELLEARLPDFDGEPVLIQGDTGPGNFMYADGKVSAIVDWELAHIGDPMDDIAWLSWRSTAERDNRRRRPGALLPGQRRRSSRAAVRPGADDGLRRTDLGCPGRQRAISRRQRVHHVDAPPPNGAHGAGRACRHAHPSP